MIKLAKTNRPPYTISCFIGYERDTICNISDINANIKYEEMHTNVMPKVKFSFLLGLIICHKKGIPNNKIGYAVMPSLLLTMVNQ